MLLNEAVAGRLQAIRREFPSAWAGLARLLPGLEPEEVHEILDHMNLFALRAFEEESG